MQQNDNDVDQIKHMYCTNHMKQNIYTWPIHTSCHTKAQSCVLSKADPESPAGPAGGVLGWGQSEVTQVVLLLFHLPPSDWDDDPDQTWSLGRFWNICPGCARSSRPATKSKPLRYHSYLLIQRPKPDTKLAHGDTLHTSFFPLPASFKESFYWFKAGFRSERQQRETWREEEVHADSENCHTLAVTEWCRAKSIASCRQQLTALLTLECSAFVRFQT